MASRKGFLGSQPRLQLPLPLEPTHRQPAGFQTLPMCLSPSLTPSPVGGLDPPPGLVSCVFPSSSFSFKSSCSLLSLSQPAVPFPTRLELRAAFPARVGTGMEGAGLGLLDTETPVGESPKGRSASSVLGRRGQRAVKLSLVLLSCDSSECPAPGLLHPQQ